MATGEIELDSPVVTMDGTVVGTPYYMSPEQARGGWIDERSDVYAIGAMMYDLLAGRPPYRNNGDEATPYDVLGYVIKGPPAPLPEGERSGGARGHLRSGHGARGRGALRGRLEAGRRPARLPRGPRRAGLSNGGSLEELRKWTRRNRGLAAAATAALRLPGGRVS